MDQTNTPHTRRQNQIYALLEGHTVTVGDSDDELVIGPNTNCLSQTTLSDADGFQQSTAEAVSQSLSILECGPLDITAPLLAAVFLLPLRAAISHTFLLWLWGASNEGVKEALARLATAHLGDPEEPWSISTNTIIAIIKRVRSLRESPVFDERSSNERRVNAWSKQAFVAGLGEVVPARGPCLLPLFAPDARLNRSRIEALAVQKHHFPKVMAAYLKWLPSRRLSPASWQIAYLAKDFRTLAGPSLPESLVQDAAALAVGMELICAFARDLGVDDVPSSKEMRRALTHIVERATVFRVLREATPQSHAV